MSDRRFTHAAALSLATLALSFAPSLAHAAKGSVTISHAAMSLSGSEAGAVYSQSVSGGALTVISSSFSTVCFVTGFTLPAGAVPNEIETWTKAEDRGSGFFIDFTALKLPTGNAIVATDVVRGNGKRRRSDFPIPAGTAAASQNTAYGLNVCIPVGGSFSGARVNYTID